MRRERIPDLRIRGFNRDELLDIINRELRFTLTHESWGGASLADAVELGEDIFYKNTDLISETLVSYSLYDDNLLNAYHSGLITKDAVLGSMLDECLAYESKLHPTNDTKTSDGLKKSYDECERVYPELALEKYVHFCLTPALFRNEVLREYRRAN